MSYLLQKEPSITAKMGEEWNKQISIFWCIWSILSMIGLRLCFVSNQNGTIVDKLIKLVKKPTNSSM